MEQLDLFQWAKDQAKLTDLGGECLWCLESCNWKVINDELHCMTPRYDLDELKFVELCGRKKLYDRDGT